MTGRVLLLGGTGEARALAAALVAAGVPVLSSLAGRVRDPRLPMGDVRVGGFGGVPGLTASLAGVAAVVDATHPFAQRISANAVTACAAAGVPLLRLARPGWHEGHRWHRVPDLAAAAALLPGLGTRVMLTTGRQGLAAFAGLDDLWFLVRCVDPPEVPLPRRHRLLLARGPYDVDAERRLMASERIDVLVTKDSGGDLTSGKLGAAAQLGIPVVVVDRPPPAGAAEVAAVDAALAWVLAQPGVLVPPGP